MSLYRTDGLGMSPQDLEKLCTEGERSTFVVTIPFEIADISEMISDEKDAGAIVTKAFDGKQAVDIFTENPAGTFDAILMDVMMPVMNGIEATKTIRLMDRSDARMIPIIAMTANAFEEDRQATKEAGMNAHLSKPLEGKEVLRVISRCSQK